MIKVSVVGAKGRMGSHVVEAVNNAEDTQLALALDAGDDLTQITTDNTDVVVEFTVPSVSLNNVLTLIGQGVDVVVGTTGWTDEKLAQVKSAIANGPKPETQKVFIAPNFAISAVLADYFATKAAKYFESAEVIELHHPTKVDAPSGTAIHTAHGIAEARKAAGLAPLVHALNGDGYQAVMAKAALKVKDVIPSTTMRLPNIGPDATQLDKAEEGMRAAGLL